jgi:hypothetical protein
MSKKNKNKHHRSKASRKRRAALKKVQEAANKGNVVAVSASDIDDFPTLDQVGHSFNADDLGHGSTPGLMSLSLAAYVKGLRDRVLEGEHVKPNAFIEFGYSFLNPFEWANKKVMHANGGTNLPTMAFCIADTEDVSDVILQMERAARDTIAQMNELGEDIVRSVHLRVSETNKEKDPRTSYGCPYTEEDADYTIENELSISL